MTPTEFARQEMEKLQSNEPKGANSQVLQ